MEPLIIKFFEFLSQKLDYDYTFLANLFSEVQGTTIEKFLITHKIERVKELLIYDELNLTEIAYLMHYSSVSQSFRTVQESDWPDSQSFQTTKRRSLLENV